MGILRVSDFRTVLAADAGKAGKMGATLVSIVDAGSTSINKASFSAV